MDSNIDSMIQSGDTKGIALACVAALAAGEDPTPYDDALDAAIHVRDLARPPIDPPLT